MFTSEFASDFQRFAFIIFRDTLIATTILYILTTLLNLYYSDLILGFFDPQTFLRLSIVFGFGTLLFYLSKKESRPLSLNERRGIVLIAIMIGTFFLSKTWNLGVGAVIGSTIAGIVSFFVLRAGLEPSSDARLK